MRQGGTRTWPRRTRAAWRGHRRSSSTVAATMEPTTSRVSQPQCPNRVRAQDSEFTPERLRTAPRSHAYRQNGSLLDLCDGEPKARRSAVTTLKVEPGTWRFAVT